MFKCGSCLPVFPQGMVAVSFLSQSSSYQLSLPALKSSQSTSKQGQGELVTMSVPYLKLEEHQHQIL